MSQRKRILFVGYSCLDLVFKCHNYPEEDTDHRASYNEWRRGGNAANNSTVMKQLIRWSADPSLDQMEVEYLGTVADDNPSEFLLKNFKENEIIIENVVKESGSQCPTSAVLVNAQNGSRTIVHFNKDLPLLSWEVITKLDLEKYLIIHFEGLRNPEQISKMIRYIREKDVNREIKITMEWEKNWGQLKQLFSEDIDVFFVESEFAKMILNLNDSEETVKGVSRLVHSKALVISPWGETGAKALDNQHSDVILSSNIFAPKEGVVDTLGAGDTFLSATLFALFIREESLAKSIEFGCRVAGAKCARFGYKHLYDFESYI